MAVQTAVFGGGCFWCTEAIFKALRGVQSVEPGYSGGDMPHPTYEKVSSGSTGYAESIKIEFDPEQISFKDLLRVFFATHDPTTLNRQGHDVGPQYRSAVFYTDDAQKKDAEEIMAEVMAEGVYPNPIVTELAPYKNFYVAEDYHKNYLERNPNNPYCQLVINPKLAKFKKKFAGLLKADA